MTRLVVVGALCGAMFGCNAPAQDRQASSAQQITGNERIGWDQEAASAADANASRYVLYVDGSPHELVDVTCGQSRTAEGYPCAARLPVMKPGDHTLELSAAVIDPNGRFESAPSRPLRVFVLSGARSSTVLPQAVPAAGGVDEGPLVRTMTDGVMAPSDLAFAPDGRLYIADRLGLVRVFRDGRLLDEPALTLTDVVGGSAGGLLSIAVDPEFSRTGFVFTLYAAERGLRLARFRAVGNTLGERAILLDELGGTVSDRGSIRFGPDAKLYLALGDGGDAAVAGDLGSYRGKILRLNPDGTTPRDQAGATAIFVSGVNMPRGIEWSADGSTLWFAETDADGAERLWAVTTARSNEERAGTPAGPVARSAAGTAASSVSGVTLPRGTSVAGILAYRDTSLPGLAGRLLLADGGSGTIFSLRLDPTDPGKIIETTHVLAGKVDGISAVAEAPDGSIYIGTSAGVLRLGSS